MTGFDFQRSLLDGIDPTTWRDRVQQLMADAERRRPMARYNTGTISEAACLYLLALTNRIRPKTVIEVGTFIGTSSTVMSLFADRIYTCDKSNDCFPGTARIVCHPFTGSKRMLTGLRGRLVEADLFFFDGRISDDEIPSIRALSHATTVYAFDDFEGEEKGVINVKKLMPQLALGSHVLITPPTSVYGLDSKTTIALLVPGDWL